MKLRCLMVVSLLVGAAIAQQPALSPGKDRAERIYDAYEAQLRQKLDAHFHAGEYEACVGILKILVAQNPNDAQTVSDLVFMLGNVGREAESLAEAIQFRRNHPQDAVAAQVEANYYIKPTVKLYDRVPVVLEPIIEQSQFLQNFVSLARAYEEMGLLNEAIRIHELRIQRFPNDPTTATVRAKIEQLKARIKA